MFARLAEASTSLDIGTLFVTAGCVTALLGLFLLFAWVQERMAALAWWGQRLSDRRLLGGALALGKCLASFSAPRRCRRLIVHRARYGLDGGAGLSWPRCPLGCDVLRRDRLDRGRRVARMPHTPAVRIMPGSVIVAVYTFMIAAELWRERRKSLIRRWPALFVPMLHGAIFLFPVALASLGVRSLATG
ncbi:MAG: hypothetical protein WBE48_23585 [Xanthobacteraceae bacterium]